MRWLKSKKSNGFSMLPLSIFCSFFFSSICMGEVKVLVDHVGYEARSPKQGLVQGVQQDHPREFHLVDTMTGKTVFSGALKPAGEVNSWGGQVFWIADFSSWQKTGEYALETQTASGKVRSCTFAIDTDLLERSTLSNVVFYFKGQRASGLDERA